MCLCVSACMHECAWRCICALFCILNAWDVVLAICDIYTTAGSSFFTTFIMQIYISMTHFYLLLLFLLLYLQVTLSLYTGQWADVRKPLCSHSFLLNLVPAFSSLFYIFYYLTMVATYQFPLHVNTDALLSSLSLTILLTLQSFLF